MAKKLTTEQFVDLAKGIHGDLYSYDLSVYKNYMTPLKIICKKHVTMFEQKPNNHLHGAGCPMCGSEKRSLGFTGHIQQKKDTLESFIEKAKFVHGDKYSYSKSIYISTKVAVEIVCKKHGSFFKTPTSHIHSKIGCPKCSGRLVDSKESFLEVAKKIHGDRFDYSNVDYKNTKTKISIICKVHGAFLQSPHNHMQGNGCYLCSQLSNGNIIGDTLRTPFSDFLKKAKVVHSEKYEYSEDGFLGIKSKVKFKCEKHGWVSQIAESHLLGNICPRCSNNVSAGENELFDFVRLICPDAKQSDRKLIKPQEIDIVVPTKLVAIEYNGLAYHSDRIEGRIDSYHLDKTKACNDAGYRLIHIWEDDWRDRKDVVKNNLKHILGVSERKLFARKCKIETIKSAEANEFFNKNHIQGGAKGGICYALIYGDEMVAAMTFGHHVSNRGVKRSEVFELIRYATNCQVVGGASKLLKAFLRDNPECESVISYSNNEMYDGGMYRALGFDMGGVSKPDYKVVVRGVRRHKSGFKLDNLRTRLGEKFDPTLTERENCRNNGLYRVYNCGLTKWVYKTKPL